MKKSLLVDRDGGPLAIVVTAANVNDAQGLAETLEAIVIPRPKPTIEAPQHLCLDRGDDTPTTDAVVAQHRYQAHVARRGTWILNDTTPPPPRTDPENRRHRRVVERTIAWLSKCRGLLIRYEKQAANFLGLLQLACALLWYRRRLRSTNMR